MAVHDAYARLTPYELLLPEPDFADRRFPAIGDEAAQQGVDAGNPAAFVMLGAVQAALACDRPAVIEVAVDPNALYSFRRDSFKHRGG